MYNPIQFRFIIDHRILKNKDFLVFLVTISFQIFIVTLRAISFITQFTDQDVKTMLSFDTILVCTYLLPNRNQKSNPRDGGIEF